VAVEFQFQGVLGSEVRRDRHNAGVDPSELRPPRHNSGVDREADPEQSRVLPRPSFVLADAQTLASPTLATSRILFSPTNFFCTQTASAVSTMFIAM
jgi:hypothetical protein